MIEHIIHFTVPAPMSAAQQQAIDTAREKNPGWEIKVWQDPVDPAGFRLSPFWRAANSGAQLADLIRLEVVFKYGGIYVDSDVALRRSLGPIADHCDFFVASEDGELATNAVFGAARGHAALAALIENLLASPPDWSLSPVKTTGPEFFARVLKWRPDVKVLPRETFYPYNWNAPSAPPHPATYGVHAWSGSWVSEPRNSHRGAPRTGIRQSLSRLKSNLKTSERAIRFFSPKLGGFATSGELVRRTVHGHTLLLSGQDVSVTPELYLNGYYELREELFLRRALRGGDYFIDVGANVGAFSVLAATRVGPFGRVFAYEPNPRVADLLRKSAVMNWLHERIVVRPAAAGLAKSTARLLVAPSSLGGATLAAGSEGQGAPDRTREFLTELQSVDVDVVALDEEFPFDVPIRIIKIDAEGFEPEVLAGASRLFRNQCVDFVIIEAVEEVSGPTWLRLIEALKVLASHGYVPHVFRRDGMIEKTTIDKVRMEGGQGSRNIVMKRSGAGFEGE